MPTRRDLLALLAATPCTALRVSRAESAQKPYSITVPLRAQSQMKAGGDTLTSIRWAVTDEDRLSIWFTLSGNNPYTISMAVSLDDGESFPMVPRAVTGDIGEGILPGSDRAINWDVFREMSSLRGRMVVQLTAEEEPSPPWGKWRTAGMIAAAAGALVGISLASWQRESANQPPSIKTATVLINVVFPGQ